MKPSKFNILIPLKDKEEFIIFNTFTDSRVIVDNRIKEMIEKLPSSESSFSEVEKSYLKELLDLCIVLMDNVDEDLELEYWFQVFIYIIHQDYTEIQQFL